VSHCALPQTDIDPRYPRPHYTLQPFVFSSAVWFITVTPCILTERLKSYPDSAASPQLMPGRGLQTERGTRLINPVVDMMRKSPAGVSQCHRRKYNRTYVATISETLALYPVPQFLFFYHSCSNDTGVPGDVLVWGRGGRGGRSNALKCFLEMSKKRTT